MPLITSSIVPHPPLIIPAIGKKNRDLLRMTISALNELQSNFYQRKIDTIIIISPHGPISENEFLVNLSFEFEANFEEFGDYATKKTFQGDMLLASEIVEEVNHSIPTRLIHYPRLDYGSAVPLIPLADQLGKIKIVPIYFNNSSLHDHFKFGEQLRTVINNSNKRIAILASGDLSHKINRQSPAGYTPKAQKFDAKLIDLLKNKKRSDILDINPDLAREVCECGLKSIVIMLGVLSGSTYSPELLSYEAPLGVGYLVMDFQLGID